LKQASDGVTVAEICCETGISEASYVNLKKNDGLLPTEMRRLKQLEDESAKLKKLVANRSLDKEKLQDVLRRKLLGLPASASWWMRYPMTGACRSARLAGLYCTTRRVTTTRLADAVRPT
jgi:putative transposase